MLLRRASAGDQLAFAAIFDATAPRVYGLARRILRDPTQAEEVSQEAYIELWRTASRFDADRGTVVGWMMTITHRRAVDRVRYEEARVRRDERYHRAELPLRGGADDAPLDALVSSSEALRVRDALTALSHPQREALELAYFGGLTCAEVALRTGVPLGTAKSRMRDGLARLRDRLAEP